MKVLKQLATSKQIAMEIRCLQLAGSKDCFVMELLSCVRHHQQIALILPYFPHDNFRTYYDNMTQLEIKTYFVALFTALSHIHKLGIVHRDIKPSNFLYNRPKKMHCLGDFGQAILNTIGLENHVGTRGFRAPEILLKIPGQGGAVDVWASGMILLSILSCKYPFLTAESKTGQLNELVALCGTKQIVTLAKRIGRHLKVGERLPRDLEKYCTKVASSKNTLLYSKVPNSKFFISQAFIFLYQCLAVLPENRITSAHCLDHPFLL